MITKTDVALCIPIYKPQSSFLFNLQNFLSKNQIAELVIIETMDKESKSECIDSISEIVRACNTKLVYDYCPKTSFQHGDSRNELFNLSSSKYVIFSTQDSEFTNTINVSELIHEIEGVGLDAICVRHTTNSLLFTKIFDDMFTKLSKIDYMRCDSDEIQWWSHNFAIYNRSSIEALPFPRIRFAEDLYWAKSARTRGLKLRIVFSQAIKHQNLDTISQSFRRGELEALGHFEGHLFCNLIISRISFLRKFSNILRRAIRFPSKLSFRSFFLDLTLIRNSMIQQLGFVLTWNRAIRIDRGKKL